MGKTNEVIDKHINMGSGARMEEEWRLGLQGWVAGREHKHSSERGTGALLSGDHRISQVGDQQIPKHDDGALPILEHVDGALPMLEHVDGALPMLEHDVSTLPDWLGG